MTRPRLKEVLVVEGRYDKNTLSQVVDATIVELGGFAVFNSAQKLALLRRLAAAHGVVIFTDPDGAGFVIRNYLKGALPKEQVKHAYVPDVYGKEKRKKTAGKEGKLGVEGMPPDVLLDALRRAGATFEGEETPEPSEPITKADLLDLGLIGEGSRERRAALVKELDLPEHLTPNALLEVLNLLFSRSEFLKRHCQTDSVGL